MPITNLACAFLHVPELPLKRSPGIVSTRNTTLLYKTGWVVQVRSAGERHAGAALSIYDYGSPYNLENEVLREQLRLIAEEMDSRVSTGGAQSAQGRTAGHAATASPGQHADSSAHSTPARRTHSGGGVVRLQ